MPSARSSMLKSGRRLKGTTGSQRTKLLRRIKRFSTKGVSMPARLMGKGTPRKT